MRTGWSRCSLCSRTTLELTEIFCWLNLTNENSFHSELGYSVMKLYFPWRRTKQPPAGRVLQFGPFSRCDSVGYHLTIVHHTGNTFTWLILDSRERVPLSGSTKRSFSRFFHIANRIAVTEHRQQTETVKVVWEFFCGVIGPSFGQRQPVRPIRWPNKEQASLPVAAWRLHWAEQLW